MVRLPPVEHDDDGPSAVERPVEWTKPKTLDLRRWLVEEHSQITSSITKIDHELLVAVHVAVCKAVRVRSVVFHDRAAHLPLLLAHERLAPQFDLRLPLCELGRHGASE